MAALVDLVDVDEVVIGALGPASQRPVDLAGKDRPAAGREMSTALKLLALFSQYSRAEEVAVPVNQYSEMSSSISSLVSDRSGSPPL